MADIFGAIAASKETPARAPLIIPSPVGKSEKTFPLSPCDDAPSAVYNKMKEKRELDREIARLKSKYAPFRRRVAPKFKSERRRVDLTEFDFSVDGGKTTRVTLPHYDGPVGKSEAVYTTTVYLEKLPDGRALFLHFDGADYISEVYFNGSFVGMHEGFFGAFEFDVSKYAVAGENEIKIILKNDFIYMGNATPDAPDTRIEGDKLYAATGPGYDDPAWGWHHCPPGFGIYQGVYLEERPTRFVSDIFVRPLPESDEFEVWTTVYSTKTLPPDRFSLSYSVYGSNFDETVVENFEYEPMTFTNDADGYSISEYDLSHRDGREAPTKLKLFCGENTVRFRFCRKGLKLWSPDAPYLYEAQVTLSVDGKEVETQASRFGMRSFIIDESAEIKGMPYLNGVPCRLRGANTMGFEQQDVMRGDMEQLEYDMLMAKACNMNFLRLTQRPVQHEIYELCDEIGLMIQTDLPLFASMRRTKFAEGVRQAEEMEKLIRSHPCCVIISYFNEPSKNANNAPHRHLARHELEGFFRACDEAVRIYNPDRAIKYIDGDYDPPSATLPDNHCYCTWYNGHGIDMGKLYRGYWLGVKEGWYYACGEFGAEGLDTVDLMRRRYPKEWLPQNEKEEKAWSPSRIVNAQSGNMHFFFYDTQTSLDDWVRESRRHQSFGTALQTGAFRRDAKMVSFAIHLFIDAFPSGWMKTIVDCEREPKPAFFVYRDLLTPLMVSLRTDRKTFFEGENVKIEAYVCNDTQTSLDGHTLKFELIKDGKAVMRGVFPADVKPNDSVLQGEISFKAPPCRARDKYDVRAILCDKDGNVLHYADEPIEIYKKEEILEKTVETFDGLEGNIDKIVSLAAKGKTVVVENPDVGEYDVAGRHVKVKSCGMRPLHFVSRNTGHALVNGFEPYDFSMWYSEDDDMMTPLIFRTFECDGVVPILTSGNNDAGSAWGKPLHKTLVTAEIPCGRGRIVINMLDLKSHLKNPVAVKFYNRLYRY
ncbi:MAG: glycoside hydrolase family 2 [Clostridia bacterium]|nr:glycoside hydrolase family 2 [Clostridia bacterium]